MNKMTSEAKVHYKSYKAGKHWVVASITAVTLGVGLMGATETARADSTSSPDATAAKTEQVTEPAQQVTLKTPVTVEPAAKEDLADNPEQTEKTSTPDKPVTADPVDPEDTQPEETKTTDAPDTPDTPDVDPEANQKVNEPAADGVEQSEGNQPDGQMPPEDTNDGSGVDANDVTAERMQAPAVALAAPAAPSPIDGVDASVWIPDAALRDAIIKQLNREASSYNGAPMYVVTESNLYQYVDKLTSLDDTIGAPIVTDFTGLAYFKNLHSLNFTRMSIPVSALIDFTVVPQLSHISLYLADDGANHDLTRIMNTYLSQNLNLSFLKFGNSYLTGSIPDLSKYTKLTMIYLPNNQLTGQIPDLSMLPNLWSVDVSHNQLSGGFPNVGTWPAMTTLDVSYNQLTGSLPDLSGYRGELTYMFNHLSNGVIQVLDQDGQPTVNYGVYQRLIGHTYKLSADQRTFDPVTGVVTGFQDMNTGQIDDNEGTWTAALTNGVTIAYGDLDPNLPTSDIAAWAATAEDATDWFSVQRVSGHQVALNFTAKQDVPDGTYTIHVINQSYGALWGYSAYITFKIENEVPVDPGNPGTPDPGVTTGLVNVVNVDQDGKVISQSQQSGHVGDRFTITAPTLAGYKLVGNGVATGTYTADGQTVTFTYQAVTSGGDGDEIAPTAPVVDDEGEPVTSGATDQAVPEKTVTAKTVTAKADKTAPAKTSPISLAATTTTTKQNTTRHAAKQTATTLPQTDGETVSPWAGLALLIGGALTGFIFKRHQ